MNKTKIIKKIVMQMNKTQIIKKIVGEPLKNYGFTFLRQMAHVEYLSGRHTDIKDIMTRKQML